MHLVVAVINDREKGDEILSGYLELGITGTTVIASEGMGRLLTDDIPIFAGLSSLLAGATRLPHDTPRGIGLGLISQGGISLAMVLSSVLTLGPLEIEVFGFAAVDLLFSTVVIGVVLSEMIGPILVAKVLTRAGELRSRPTERTATPTGSLP